MGGLRLGGRIWFFGGESQKDANNRSLQTILKQEQYALADGILTKRWRKAMSRKLIVIAIVLVASVAIYVQRTFSDGSPSEARGAPIQNTVAGGLAPGTIPMYPERIPLKDGGFALAERGMLFVPVNRSDPKSAVIGVEVYRFKASKKAEKGTPPIFFLHGGPSFAGLERQLGEIGTFEERWRPYLDVSDLVIVSQRGIGPSKPTTTIDMTPTRGPLDENVDDEKTLKEFQQICAREKAFWESQGLDLSGFTVIEAAADVDDVRKALGYDKITIWGGSFGSHWGMTFMRYYPETVERAILRGMEGPDHTYDHPGHIWNVYKRVAEEAEKSRELKDLIPEGGLIEAITTVMERIEEKPLKVTVTDPETGKSQDVLFSRQSEAGQRLARGYSGGLPAWPADVLTLYNGDFSKAAERAVERRSDAGRNFRTASYFMLDCGSGITPKRLAEYKADPAVKIIGMLNYNYLAGCPVWRSDLGEEFRQNFETSIPTVIVHGTWDTSTPYENALELVPYFKNSKFIPVIRGPHGSIRAARSVSKPFDEGILKFAATGDWSGLPDKVEMPPVKWVVPVIE
jgi:pimeloyl-ACP methyl ester carboxylesterase